MAEAPRVASEPQIAALVARSLTSFKALTSTLQDDHSQALQASSCLARFKLWAGNLGAHRPSGGRSLEYRLRDASNIRKVVISLLRDLCSSIEQGTLVANGGSIFDTTSESHDAVEDDLADYFNEDEDSDKSEVEQTLDEIAHVVDCLLRLSVTIRNPAPHDQFLSRAGEGLVKEFVYWDAKHVQDKFPKVRKDLAERLGRAMARRRQYFKYREEHKSRLAEGLDEDEAEFGERATTIASSLPEHLKEAGKSTEGGASRFAILDDGRSDASATSYATSSPDSTQLRVPPIPKEHIDGSFKCPFCHMIVSIDTRHGWKKHVFRDLRPYVCLSQACQAPDHLYIRRNDWKMHMRREHWKTWYCPFGCDAEFDCAKGFQNHVKTAHEQNVSLEKVQTLEGLSSHADVAKAKGQCPLCYDFQVGSEKQYEKHIGQHLEHLALFTLPDTGRESDDDEDGNEDKEEERLDDGDEDDEDDDEEDEEEDWVATDDPGNKVADQRWKAQIEALDGLRKARESQEIHQAAKKTAADGDEGALAEAVANYEEESKMAAAVAEAKEAAEKAAQELKDKIQKEAKAKLDESENAEQLPIRFKDAIGRRFAFPFRLCKTWQGMEDLIKQSFLQVEVIGPHVMEGHYDLIGPDGEIILPSVWEKVIQPDSLITMTLWPGYEMPSSGVHWTHQPVKVPASPPGMKDPEKIRLEAELAAFKAMEEKQKAAEKQKELEAQIRKEAEEEFSRRMEAMRIAQEEAKEEIEKARIEAEKAARERIEAERKAEEERARKHAEAMAAADEKARLRFEAEMKSAESRRQAEADARARAEEKARLMFEAEVKAAEAKRKEEAEERVRAEEEVRLLFESEAEARARAEENARLLFEAELKAVEGKRKKEEEEALVDFENAMQEKNQA